MAISDIHGNLEALESVLADIAAQQITEIFCLGDVIGYGPNPRECIDVCRGFELTLLGNHDNGALFDPEGFSSGAERAIFWTRAQLEDKSKDAQARWDFLAGLPRTHRMGDVMFVHGSPRSPLNEYVFPEDIYNQRKIERIFGFIQKYCFQSEASDSHAIPIRAAATLFWTEKTSSSDAWITTLAPHARRSWEFQTSMTFLVTDCLKADRANSARHSLTCTDSPPRRASDCGFPHKTPST